MKEEMYNMAMFIIGGVWTGCATHWLTRVMGVLIFLLGLLKGVR